jgi:hypothetical protein
MWSLVTCGIGGLGTLMTAGVDYEVLGMNVVIACAGALVNMMFTMAMFLDNSRRDCSAGLVAEEAPAEPLSDQAIQEKLEQAGIHVARRTVAKYRIVLKIPPSHQRRRS